MLRLRKSKNFLGEVNLTPILDLSLILVIFLAVTTEFVSGGRIKVSVPEGGETVGKVVGEKIVIDKAGRVFFNGERVENPGELLDLIEPSKPVLVKADKETPYQFVFTVLDILRQANVERVVLVGTGKRLLQDNNKK
jgi:biopolymer transport protein ExbD